MKNGWKKVLFIIAIIIIFLVFFKFPKQKLNAYLQPPEKIEGIYSVFMGVISQEEVLIITYDDNTLVSSLTLQFNDLFLSTPNYFEVISLNASNYFDFLSYGDVIFLDYVEEGTILITRLKSIFIDGDRYSLIQNSSHFGYTLHNDNKYIIHFINDDDYTLRLDFSAPFFSGNIYEYSSTDNKFYLVFSLDEVFAGGFDVGYSEGFVNGVEAGKNLGYDDGFSEGYDEGYDEGKRIGYAEGYDQGFFTGINQGESLGYSEGFAAGKQIGYRQGYDEAYALVDYNSYNLGWETGVRQGYDDGFHEGYLEGYDVGINLNVNELNQNWMISILAALGSILSIKLFGDISIGIIVGVPLVVYLVLFVLRIIRGN